MNSKTAEMYERARTLIPGGTQLLSKRPEMLLPEQWPAYYAKAKGAEVWDLDGRKYTDMISGGIGSCVLGYADPDVDAAVHAAIEAGSMSNLNCPEEVELADLLIELHPWAHMVRYGRCGGEALAIAIRIARAKTGRDTVAFCGYHGWHDWYLAANLSRDDALQGHLLPGLEAAGVPRGLAGTALPFRYNKIDELEKIVAAHRNDLAAIIMEPVRNYQPEPGFLERVRELAEAAGAVLIFDEVTSGWRMNSGGVHLLYGVAPHMAVFAKAMSNGYPMAAVIGVEDVMQAAQSSFISSTYWTEKIGPVAALATIAKHRRCNVPLHLSQIGEAVRSAWRAAAAQNNVAITVTGIPALAFFAFNYPNGQAVRTLFTQMMLERGFLATSAIYPTYAHTPAHVAAFAEALHEAFQLIGAALEQDAVEKLLQGPIAHSGFRRLA
ncbi:MAG TPA: aminotransferase class III-fold pyridoxal phosphate-dependent enzyme [Abditibacteriaceae bacterium]|nr:aminotransferase class III-fold pyridoxal phosphate-dependent enzyme [Abditibacteriaceae bacterium]